MRLGLESVAADIGARSYLASCIDDLCRSRFLKLIPRLKRGLVHVTSPVGYAGILKEGAILPNDGRLPDTYPQSKESACRLLGAVGLFDFVTPTQQQFVEQFHKCEQFFTCHYPATLALIVRAGDLPAKLIRYDEQTQKAGRAPTKIPHVEVCHPAPIPAGAIESVIGIRDRPLRFRSFSPGNPFLLDVPALLRRTWPLLDQPPNSREEAMGQDEKQRMDDWGKAIARSPELKKHLAEAYRRMKKGSVP